MAKFYAEKINLFVKKDTEDKPKHYLLGIDCRLQLFRAKLGLVSFKEGHCHGGMTRPNQIFSLQWYYYEWHR